MAHQRTEKEEDKKTPLVWKQLSWLESEPKPRSSTFHWPPLSFDLLSEKLSAAYELRVFLQALAIIFENIFLQKCLGTAKK